MAKMDSTNIEYLLQNYKVSEVTQIQQKLKNDVEKKKNDLRNLIGERYSELLKATESIDRMNTSVDNLIVSLKHLSQVLDSTHSETGKQSSLGDNHLHNYNSAVIYKVLFDLPFQIWNLLHHNDIIFATYTYFYGVTIYEYLHRTNSKLLKNNMCLFNKNAIASLNGHIVGYCWRYILQQSTENEIDDSKFADIFSCVVLLDKYDILALIKNFFEKQTINVLNCFNSDLKLSTLFKLISNIIFNVTKCSKIFYEESHYDSLLFQRYKRIVTLTYVLDYSLPSELGQFRIDSCASKVDLTSDETLNDYKHRVELWVKSIKQSCSPILESTLKNQTSIDAMLNEVQSIELTLSQNYRFKDWQDYIDILNIEQSIWKDWFMAAIEKRIYEIFSEKINLIVNDFGSQLPSYETILFQCDLNIVEFIWKNADLTSPNKSNQLLACVSKSCEMINSHLDELAADISLLKEAFQHLLLEIYSKFYNTLNSLKELVDSHKEVRQFTLFGAVLFRQMLDLCPNIRVIYGAHYEMPPNAVTWRSIESMIKSTSDSYLCEWFTAIVSQHFQVISVDSLVDLNEFLKNLTLWEVVSLSNPEASNNGPVNSSVIEVPVQLSLTLYRLLQDICVDINRFCAYQVPRTVQIHILTQLGTSLINLYQDAIKRMQTSEQLPKASKQIMAIQLFFDLSFTKKLLAMLKDGTLRSNLVPQINELMSLLESTIDPFDLHLIYPHIQINCDKLFKSSYIVFGFLMFDKNASTSLKINILPKASQPEVVSREITHNVMLVHSCEEPTKTVAR